MPLQHVSITWIQNTDAPKFITEKFLKTVYHHLVAEASVVLQEKNIGKSLLIVILKCNLNQSIGKVYR